MFNHCFCNLGQYSKVRCIPSTYNSLFPGTLRTEETGKVREIASKVHSVFLKFNENKFL